MAEAEGAAVVLLAVADTAVEEAADMTESAGAAAGIATATASVAAIAGTTAASGETGTTATGISGTSATGMIAAAAENATAASDRANPSEVPSRISSWLPPFVDLELSWQRPSCWIYLLYNHSMTSKFPFDRINWFTSAFLIVTFFTALVGVPLYIAHFGLDWFQILLFLVLFIATGMSITLGYHRLFAHKTFKAGRTVKMTTLLFGAAAFEDSALDWASDHRQHHKHVDDEHDDPYSISRGFFWAHMGWIFFKLYPRPLANVGDLKKDSLVMWQHRYHRPIGVLIGLALPTLLGYLYGGWPSALGAFLIGGIARIVAVQHSTFFINSLCHTIGKRPYDSGTSARDSWIMALFTFGEGYHNYHHSFQHDYRNGVKPWQWDPTKWAIWTLSKLGLASELRRVSEEKIVLAELREMKRRAEAQIASNSGWKISCPTREEAYATLVDLSQQLAEGYQELEKAVSEHIKIPGAMLSRWRQMSADVGEQILLLRTLQPSMA